MCWLKWQDSSLDFLLALHPPYNLVLWNADSGEKIWKKSYTDSLVSMALDPFNLNRIACEFGFVSDALQELKTGFARN